MAADLVIHAMCDPATEADLQLVNHRNSDVQFEALCRLEQTPRFWVCEVSWLKAALTGDRGEYVPGVAERVTGAIGRSLPTLDDALVERLTLAMFETADNATMYETVGPERLDEWTKWCDENRGRKVFHVSW